MPDAQKRYRRLPGTGYRRMIPGWAMVALFFVIGIFVLLLRGRRVQLWQGEEHLLLVEWDGYREYYKRFGYKDIQAIVVRQTIEGTLVTIIFGIITAFFVVLLLSSPDVGLRIFLGTMAFLTGIVFAANLLMGPSCQTSIRTAVQTEELQSLSRVRRARKVLNRLRPLMAAAQGSMTPEEVASRVQAGAASPAPRVNPAATASTSPAAGPAPVGENPDTPPIIGS